jgi:hypothetical protein
VSQKNIKKNRLGYLNIVESLNIKNSKHQITNNKQFICNLVLVIWDLTNFILEKKVQLNQSEFCKLHVGDHTICAGDLFCESPGY